MKSGLSKWITLACVAMAMPACSAPWWPRVLVSEGFEQGLEDWNRGADVPEDPNQPGQTVAWSITQSDVQARTGTCSAQFDLDGKQDDGTIWLTRSFDTRGPGRYRVTMILDFWSESESFNTIAKVAFYAGTAEPAVESDFDTTQPANQSSGWQSYVSTSDVTVGQARRVWVAFGISAVWETEMTYYVDNALVLIRRLGD